MVLLAKSDSKSKLKSGQRRSDSGLIIEVYNKQDLRKGFEMIFRPDSRARAWLISSIDRHIKAQRLSGIDAWDILIEAYIRAEKAITCDRKFIWNLVSWLRSTSDRIILEHKRKFARSDTFSFPEMDRIQDIDERIANYSDFQESNAIWVVKEIKGEIAKKLSPIECCLLYWRIEKKWNWSKIYCTLEANGEKPLNETSLRKKKQRALKKLQQIVSTSWITCCYTQREIAFACGLLIESFSEETANK